MSTSSPKPFLQRRDVALVLTVLLATFLALLIWASRAAAEPAAESAADSAVQAAHGRVTYRIYCSSCHGAGAKGDGITAQYLKIPPTDLTQLAASSGGEFPAEQTREVIDGRTLPGHGSRDMPIWGMAFRDPSRDSDQESEVRERIDNLVAYLESIQVD